MRAAGVQISSLGKTIAPADAKACARARRAWTSPSHPRGADV